MQLTIKIDDRNVYKSLVAFLKSLKIQIVKIDESIDSSNEDMYKISKQNINRAYSENEPDYDLNMLKEPNSTYEIPMFAETQLRSTQRNQYKIKKRVKHK